MINHFKYLLLILFSSFSFATTIHVATTGFDDTGDGTGENPFATIQKGIDSSIEGDTVLVSSGTFLENINYNGKNVAVIGENRETTIIDGNQNGNVVTFEEGENINSLLRNFTVKNSGYPGDWGGGIFINFGSTPSLDSLIIIDNTGGGYDGSYGGGGVCVIREGSKANLTNSIISNNFGESESGGLFACWQGEIVATNCIITGNNTGVASACASGSADTNIELINCTIVDNVYKGVYAFGSVSINSSIIYNNGGNESYSNIDDANVGGTLLVGNSLVQGGFEGEGNIDVDPLFCDSENGDYSLSANSPAIGAGTDGSNIGALGVGCDAISLSLTINEIMNNPSAVSDSDGEWFEIYNNGDLSFDLNGWTIKDGGSDSHVVSSSLVINPGEFKVLSNYSNQSTNGGLVADYQYDGITLANGDDELVLIDPNGTVFDSVAYDGGPEFPDLNGASMGVIDAETDNNLGSNWQASTTAYGDGDLGTPGLPNFSSDIDVELATIDFDTVLVGESLDKVLTISNTGNTTLVIDSIYTLSGSFTLPFTETSVETSLELTITFTPSEYGVVEDTLVIKTNDPDEGHIEIPLIALGYVPSPNIVLESTSIDFGTVMDGLTEMIELQVANDGDAALSLSSVYIEGSTTFTIPNFSTSVAEEDTGLIEIKFSPDDETSFSGALYIVSNDPDTDTLMVALSGIGGEQAPIMKQSDNELYFGTVESGTTVEREIIIYNEGMLDLEIEEITITGSDYYTTTFSDGSVEPGDSVIVPFSFAPTEQVAEVMAAATVASNDGTQTIELKAGYFGPVWHVATTGSDETGDGTGSYPFFTIQKGVDMSLSGDTVLVYSGTYNEHDIMSMTSTVYSRESIYLISNSGPDSTIIDGGNNGMIIRELAINMYIEGFMITGGNAYNDEDIGFRNGAIGTFSEIFRVETISIENTIFVDNQMDINFAFGNRYLGNENLENPLNAMISNCTFISSSNDFPSIRIEDDQGSYEFLNSIFFAENDQNYDHLSNTGLITLSHSLILPDLNIPDWFFESGENTYGNPLFCDLDNGDYSLAESSPAIGAGQNETDVGALGIGCGSIYNGPVWYVAITGSDETGDGSEENPFATIQKGVDSSVGGDTVLVHPGTYGPSSIANNIFLISAQGPSQTVIDANFQGTAIGIPRDNDNIVVSGFTITGGIGSYNENWIGSMYRGGGISGDGDIINFSTIHISNMIFFGNEIDINLRYADSPAGTAVISNSTFIVDRNFPTIETLNHPTTVTNCIFFDQGEGSSYDISFPENESLTISHSLFFTSLNNLGAHIDGGTNIVANPLFCDSDIIDYSLASNSPAIGAGEDGSNIGALGIGCEAIELSIDKNIIPDMYALHQNYPNPFNPTTKISYDLPDASVVSLSIYDLMGREIRTLINSEQSAGFKIIQWNATDNLGKSVPAGMYIYTIQAGEFRQTRKMVLLK